MGTSLGLVYTGTLVSLNEIWYAQYPRSSFHLFNDWKEWLQYDKVGHAYTAYFETDWLYNAARWSGMNRNNSLWVAGVGGSLFQFTLEVMDGFSEQWGFSVGDFGFNTLGVGLFVGQELAWKEQRLYLKVSSYPKTYPNVVVTSDDNSATMLLSDRAKQLYGSSFPERFLKDYNAQTTWLSVNVAAFTTQKPNWLPNWMNVAVGYGAENMYGGLENAWTKNNLRYHYPAKSYRQFFLSLDVDFTKVRTKSKFVNVLLHLLNSVKIPSPTLEYNTLGKLKFHYIYF